MILSVAFLVIAVISSLGSIQSQQGQNQPEGNSCCQGPSGIPGVPGTAGHQGLPGRDGMKGDKGDSGMNIKGDKGDTGFGEVGPIGPTGLRGEKGVQGIGLPGKTGPRGPVGPMGIKGVVGESGIGGTKGQKGDCGQSRRAAFTAIPTSNQDGSTNDVVIFHKTTVNIDGHFSLQTNKFTCQVPGIYVFMYNMGVYQQYQTRIRLVKNDNLIVTALTHTTTTGDFDQTSNSAILSLEAGDQVWLKFGSDGQRLHGNANYYSSFSGFLLYEM